MINHWHKTVCDIIPSKVSTTDTPESMISKLESALNQILSNCVDGFGHLWMDHFTNLEKMMTQLGF